MSQSDDTNEPAVVTPLLRRDQSTYRRSITPQFIRAIRLEVPAVISPACLLTDAEADEMLARIGPVPEPHAKHSSAPPPR